MVDQTYYSWSFVNFAGVFCGYLSFETSTSIATGPKKAQNGEDKLEVVSRSKT